MFYLQCGRKIETSPCSTFSDPALCQLSVLLLLFEVFRFVWFLVPGFLLDMDIDWVGKHAAECKCQYPPHPINTFNF